MTDVQAERNACADLVGSRAKSIKAEAERMRKGGLKAMAEKLDAIADALSTTAADIRKRGRNAG